MCKIILASGDWHETLPPSRLLLYQY